ncbi:MAG: SEL1-like repeat protein, partial [Proteobacteria bacterium]|nr:SEL1-like repeat protein [Pseudomonadota bacterium]
EPSPPRTLAPAGIEAVAVAANAAEAGARAWRAGDYQTALANLWAAAVDGDGPAQLLLGGMYRDGAGVAPDRSRAHFWWTLAARNGMSDAAAFLTTLEPTMAPEEIAAAARLLTEWDAA